MALKVVVVNGEESQGAGEHSTYDHVTQECLDLIA